MNLEKERKKFESRLLARKPLVALVIKQGRYVDRAIQARWAGWLDKAHSQKINIWWLAVCFVSGCVLGGVFL